MLADHAAQLDLLLEGATRQCHSSLICCWCCCCRGGVGESVSDAPASSTCTAGGQPPVGSSELADRAMQGIESSSFDASIPALPLRARQLKRPILDHAPESACKQLAPSLAVVLLVGTAVVLWFAASLVAASERLLRSETYPAPVVPVAQSASRDSVAQLGDGWIVLAGSFPFVRPNS